MASMRAMASFFRIEDILELSGGWFLWPQLYKPGSPGNSGAIDIFGAADFHTRA
jgi:hypothetical protein